MERVPTGIEGLDAVLGGGVKRGSVTLVEGTPGTGKTTIGLQFIHAGIVTYGEPGLIITFEELPDQIYEDATTFGWDLRALERAQQLRMLCISPRAFVDDFRVAGGLFDLATAELSPRRILIDSITVLHVVISDEQEFREAFYALMNNLRLKGLTSLIARELQEDVTGKGTMEEFLSDTVLRLSYEETETHNSMRFLRVVKTRGFPHRPGRHAFRFGAQGVELFPSPRPLPPRAERPTKLEKVATGVPGLDELLDYGLVRGMSTLLTGSAGTGKTTLGLQFLNEGAEVGERGLLISLEEDESKLRLLAEAYNFKAAAKIEDRLISLLCVAPVGLCVEELFARIHRMLRETGAQRVVVDGLSSLIQRISDPVYRSDYVYSLVQMFAQLEVTSILTLETDRVGAAPSYLAFGETDFSSQNLTAVVDNLILLRHVESEGLIRHGLSVLKARASGHTWDVREYTLTAQGIEVLRRVLGPGGPLSGVPLLTQEAWAVARDFSFSEAEYEDVLTLVRDRMQRIISTTLPPQDYATAEEFWAAHDHGKTSLAQLEGPSQRAGPDGTVLVLPECPFVRGLGSFMDSERYQRAFAHIVASFRAENPEVEIAYPFCIAHFQARSRAAQDTTIHGQPIQDHQLAIRTEDPQRPLLNRAALRELGLTVEKVLEWLAGGFCCYAVQVPESNSPAE